MSQCSGTAPAQDPLGRASPSQPPSPIGALEISEAQLEQALNRQVAQSLSPIAAGLGVLHLVYAAACASVFADAAQSTASFALVLSLVFLLIWRLIRRSPVPPRWAHPVATALAGLVMGSGILLLGSIRDPLLSTNLFFSMVGAGCVFASTFWLSLLLLSTVAAWLLVLWSVPPPGHDWLQFIFALVTALVLTLVIHRIRRRSLRTAERNRLQYEHQQAQLAAELRESEFRLRLVWENSADGMRLTDDQGTILEVNPAFSRLVGVPASELVGRPFTTVYRPADNPAAALERYKQKFAKRAIKPLLERKVTFLNGQTHDLEITNSFILQENRPPMLLGLFRDVTPRKTAEAALRETEALYRRAIAAADLVPYQRDRQSNRFVFLGEGIEALTGYTAAEMTCELWTALVVESHMQGPAATWSTEEAIARAQSGQLLQWRNDCKIRTRDGTFRWISDSSIELLGPDGQSIGSVGILQDITERKTSEESRLVIERKLLDSQKLESLGILAGGVAHDFNNLLTAILGNACLAGLHMAGDSSARNYLQNIEQASQKAAELCKQMLAYSGRGQFVVGPVQLNSVLHEMQPLLEVSVGKNASLQFHLDPRLPLIEADAAQIRQVILNLVLNASEAIGEKSGVISVITSMVEADRALLSSAHLSPELPEGLYTCLEVSDTGSGISPENKRRIFDPFFTTKFTGRGLGLPAVLGIVRGHKGAIKVYSEVGHGSRFRCLFPLSKAESGSSPKATPLTPWRGSGKILVADDEEPVREIVSQVLRKIGFEVVTAPDGQAAVEIFRLAPHEIAAVILDLTMPHLNGEDAFLQMRKIRQDARVLLMSGYSEQDATTHFIGLGLAGFLQKPFKPAELQTKLKQILP